MEADRLKQAFSFFPVYDCTTWYHFCWNKAVSVTFFFSLSEKNLHPQVPIRDRHERSPLTCLWTISACCQWLRRSLKRVKRKFLAAAETHDTPTHFYHIGVFWISLLHQLSSLNILFLFTSQPGERHAEPSEQLGVNSRWPTSESLANMLTGGNGGAERGRWLTKLWKVLVGRKCGRAWRLLIQPLQCPARFTPPLVTHVQVRNFRQDGAWH